MYYIYSHVVTRIIKSENLEHNIILSNDKYKEVTEKSIYNIVTGYIIQCRIQDCDNRGAQ